VSGAVIWTLVALGLAVLVVRRRSLAVALVTAQALVLVGVALDEAESSGDVIAAGALAVRAIVLAGLFLLLVSRTRAVRPVRARVAPLARAGIAVAFALALTWLVPAIGLVSRDAERAVLAASSGNGADVVLEMSGVPSAVHQAFALARPGGRVNMLGIPSKTIDIDFATEIIFKGLTIYGVVGRRMYDTWHQMSRFISSGNFDPTPVITHRLPLEAVDEAMALIKSGDAGKIIFQI